ncbi:VOC family protein [Actinomadura verrucosospora]|uniref:Glyoxalase/bleomycin resistance protein/dioxygenase n=1 Tax=Actinomadura verrucosospora TaxID=46165 RepID=A0A7D3ZGU8_ACTVE|nr:VOC family protein [Actinomadura verrucosospora]QKG19081.1 glyoxalase/bleomycin resistance protein/dioxygenase [Actinomadura verrucosospora]
MLRGLSTISFFADDVEAAGRWYAELLGTDPYFRVPGPDGRAVYLEFRIGDHQHELGLIDARFRPRAAGSGEPGGAVAYWHVDDLEGAVERLVSMGARVHEKITERGEGTGFATASVVDPFGNVLGVMTNPHYLQMLASR